MWMQEASCFPEGELRESSDREEHLCSGNRFPKIACIRDRTREFCCSLFRGSSDASEKGGSVNLTGEGILMGIMESVSRRQGL